MLFAPLLTHSFNLPLYLLIFRSMAERASKNQKEILKKQRNEMTGDTDPQKNERKRGGKKE